MDKNEQTKQQKDQTQAFEALLKEKLVEQYNRGVQVGIAAASKVVLEKLRDSSKPLMKRIVEVKQFCQTPFAKKKDVQIVTGETDKPTTDEATEIPNDTDITETDEATEATDVSEGDNTENKSE